MPMSPHKTRLYSTRKRCQTCGTVGWYQPRVQNCRVRKFGRGSYCCWGPLVDAPIVRASRTYDDNVQRCAHCGVVNARTRTQCNACHAPLTTDARRYDTQRRAAERKRDQTRARMATTKQKIERLRRLLAKQQRDERKWTKEATLSDEHLAQRRARAQHAARVSAQVQRVRRRLRDATSSSGDDDAPPMRLLPLSPGRSRTRRRAA